MSALDNAIAETRAMALLRAHTAACVLEVTSDGEARRLAAAARIELEAVGHSLEREALARSKGLNTGS